MGRAEMPLIGTMHAEFDWGHLIGRLNKQYKDKVRCGPTS